MSNSSLKTPQYNDCEVIHPDGHLMFRCHKSKIDWYLDRNLGVKISDCAIKLTFTPKGRGNANDAYHLQRMENRCVVCGDTNELTRHHVVPYCYRKFFPEEIKSHRCYDILALCVKCHSEYEYHALNLKRNLAGKYSAPIDGLGITYYKELHIARKAASALFLHKEKIPIQRQNELLERIKLYLGKDPNDEDLNDLHNNNPYNFENFVGHGEIVVGQISDIQTFVKEWRQHFLDTMKPQFMPNNWCVDRPVYRA